MADLVVTPRNVSVLPGAVVRPYKAGGTVEVGDSVYPAADGDWERTDSDSAGTARGRGLIVGIGGFGALTGSEGDEIDVCHYGPVTGIAGTPGADGYTSGTAGKIADSAGATSHSMGWQMNANTFFVNPAIPGATGAQGAQGAQGASG